MGEVGAGTLLLVVSSLCLAGTLRIRGWVQVAIGVGVLASAQVVLLTTILSWFSAYRDVPMLGAQVLVTVATAAAWIARGRPRPVVGKLPTSSELRGFMVANRTVAVLGVAVAIAAAVELLLALALPPNTWDSLMYHLSRVALWIQNHGVFGLDGGTKYEREYGANGEILYGWTMLLSGGDRLAALVPWLASIGCGGLVYWGARTLRFERGPSLFAAFMFMLLPQTVVQASSTLVDLPAAFFTGAFILFAIRAVETRSRADLVLASLAFGLALGAKGTTFLALPGIALLLVAAARHWRPSRRQLVAGLISLLIGALALSGPLLISNLADTGSPGGEAGRSQLRVSSLQTTASRTLWTFVDWPGLAGTLPVQVLQPVHDRIWPNALDPANDTYVSEDAIGFGPLVPLLLLPLLTILALARRTAVDRRLAAIAAASYVLAYIVVLETGPNASHTLVTGILMAAPLFAVLGTSAVFRHVSGFTAIAFLAPVLLQNAKKPLYPDPILGADRYTVLSQQHPFAPALQRADEIIPGDARIAYLGPSDATWDYPFFGPQLNRFVHRVEVPPGETVTADEVEELAIDYDLDAIVFAGTEPPKELDTIEIGQIAFSDHQVWFAE